MNDIVGRVIAVGLAVVLMVIAPLMILGLSAELSSKRAILNEVTSFIDLVTDTGYLTQTQVGDFQLACASHGITVDVEIKHKVKIVTPGADPAQPLNFSWVNGDDIYNWKKGDIVQVRVRAIDYTGAQKIAMLVLQYVVPKLDITMAGRIRQ